MSLDPRLESPPDVDALTARYTDKANRVGVPEHLIDGLVLYIVRGIRPGHFLEAVLENNLVESFARADVDSRAGMMQIVSFLYNDVPATCWGSAGKFNSWLNVGGLYGVQS